MMLPMVSNSEYISLDLVRKEVRFLKDHYGSLTDAAEATGIPYRTLQGIMLKGKLQQVTIPTAERVLAAAANPPPYDGVRMCSHCYKNPKVGGSYCSESCRKAMLNEVWHKRFVDVKRVKPLVDFLHELYGTINGVGEASGIPASTLNNIKYDSRMRGVRRDTAAKLVEFVMAHKRPTKNQPFDTYENERPPRFVTEEDKIYLRSPAARRK